MGNRRTCESYELLGKSTQMHHRSGDTEACDFGVVLYDARGHGQSEGWQANASNIQQFHWRSLACDMLFLAEKQCLQQRRGALLGGYSMGASSAVWAAYLYPTAVRGLVLLSVTTAWEIRAARRGTLLENAGLLEASRPEAACVVRGAAYADLPDIESLRAAQLCMPVLMACARDDTTHPAQTIEKLHTVLPHAEVHITDTTAELRELFPPVLNRWMKGNGM